MAHVSLATLAKHALKGAPPVPPAPVTREPAPVALPRQAPPPPRPLGPAVPPGPPPRSAGPERAPVAAATAAAAPRPAETGPQPEQQQVACRACGFRHWVPVRHRASLPAAEAAPAAPRPPSAAEQLRAAFAGFEPLAGEDEDAQAARMLAELAALKKKLETTPAPRPPADVNAVPQTRCRKCSLPRVPAFVLVDDAAPAASSAPSSAPSSTSPAPSSSPAVAAAPAGG